MKTMAIIGAGNMGTAIALSKTADSFTVRLSVASSESAKRLEKLGFEASRIFRDNRRAVAGADVVIVGVKPYMARDVISEIAPFLKSGCRMVSIVAGLSTESIRSFLSEAPGEVAIARVTPNTAVRLNMSLTFISFEKGCQEPVREEVLEMFRRSGEVMEVEESHTPEFTALSSCGIAYFLRFIRAATEGAVELGMKPAKAAEVAAYTARSAAALILDGGHPEVEIDKVTSPGGITIRGLNALEANGFTKAVIEALRASCIR